MLDDIKIFEDDEIMFNLGILLSNELLSTRTLYPDSIQLNYVTFYVQNKIENT